MTPLMFAVLLAFAIGLLALALWQSNAAFGVASASVFLILGGVLFSDGLPELPAFANTGLALLAVILGFGLVFQFALGEAGV